MEKLLLYKRDVCYIKGYQFLLMSSAMQFHLWFLNNADSISNCIALISVTISHLKPPWTYKNSKQNLLIFK
jgi:hypothetical protein